MRACVRACVHVRGRVVSGEAVEGGEEAQEVYVAHHAVGGGGKRYDAWFDKPSCCGGGVFRLDKPSCCGGGGKGFFGWMSHPIMQCGWEGKGCFDSWMRGWIRGGTEVNTHLFFF